MYKKIIKWFKSFTCEHKWMFDGSVSEEFKPGYYRFLSIWECKKCGKVRVGQFKDKESLWLKIRLKKKVNKKSSKTTLM